MKMPENGAEPYSVRLILLLALLYVLTGKLGLMLAVPPGYATIIWPPSGVALGMLLIYGRKLWPGILIGSFLLNAFIGGNEQDAVDGIKLLSALGIAAGSTLQASLGFTLVKYFIGLPLHLHRLRQILWIFILCGPLACIIAASCGVIVLYLSGIMSLDAMMSNWLTWWVGDMLGVLVFAPLVFVAPGSAGKIRWRDEPFSGLQVIVMLILMLPMALSFYAWKVASEESYQFNRAQFEALTHENEVALLNRLDSYDNALTSAAAFFSNSNFVSRSEWRNYVKMLDLDKNYPGISGVGWIAELEDSELPEFLENIRSDEAKNFTIHPATEGRPNYVITYIEPLAKNKKALGLNIGFEDSRVKAAELARDSGNSAITSRIILVQDSAKTPGFLLLNPLYHTNQEHVTEEARKADFRGWIYAPFIAKNFMAKLTSSQSLSFNLRIYDEGVEAKDHLIYSSGSGQGHKSGFTVRKKLQVMQQEWLIVWESTAAFEHTHRSDDALLILVGGLLFTGLFCAFLLATTVQNTETMEWLTSQHKILPSLLVFIALGLGTVFLYKTLKEKEIDYIRTFVEEEAAKIELLLISQTEAKLLALKRMAQRWEVAKGTPFVWWQQDARHYTKDIKGLRAVEWVDDSYHVRWIEPLKGNEAAVGLDILFNEEREEALKGAAQRNLPTLTPPLNLVQGYEAFIAYLPMYVDEQFVGFTVGVFSIDEFFSTAILQEASGEYSAQMNYGDKFYYGHTTGPVAEEAVWAVHKSISIYDKEWELVVRPTTAFISSQRTTLPVIVLIAGITIALLAGMVIRYILISRLNSRYLTQSNQLNMAIFASSPYLIIATDKQGNVVSFNAAASDALGYAVEDVVGEVTPITWHDPEEVVQRAQELRKQYGETILSGFDVFTLVPRNEGIEAREWTFIRRNGRSFPVNLTVTPLKNERGEITGYLSVAEDITERQQQQIALETSEETFRSAMENASIGMALVELNGKWLKVNKALCDLLGYSHDELLENDFQSITHPDDLETDVGLLKQVLSGEIKHYQLEKRYYHKSGRVIWALLDVSLVRDGFGKPDHFISQIQDITERKEMERMKSEFISIVSHELRTPLTSIRGSLGLIMGAMVNDIPAKALKLVDIAHKNSERLILLINDILDIDKIASGQMRFDMKEEALAPLLEQAVDTNQPYAEKLGVRLVATPVDSTIRIMTDSGRFLQVLANLISNAAKFSNKGEQVNITVALHDDVVRISVIDYGLGIAEEFRPRIFGKFAQADSSATREKGGTGLGLHISKQMVENMDGQIGFDTELGKGTTFWMEFPRIVQKATPVRIKTNATPSQIAADKESAKLPQILHVEEDVDLSNMLASALSGDAKIVLAVTIQEARELLSARQFDLILLDVGMPDGSGLELLDELPDPNVPVLVLSADDIPEDVSPHVTMSIMKSRMSEAYIVEKIMQLIAEKRT